MKHFENELPQGYVEAKVVDAKSTKTSIIMTLFSLLITAAVFGVGWIIFYFGFDVNLFDCVNENRTTPLYVCLVLFFGILAYTVLHELVHGLVYKLFTKQKLTFGITLSAAYCGVPNIYVYRTAAICALIAPFTVFSIVFILCIALLGEYMWLQLAMLFLFAVHFGGCVGDLYDTMLYLFKFRDGKTLMRDTGPKQTFYVTAYSKLGQALLAKLSQNVEQTDGAEPVASEETAPVASTEETDTEASAEETDFKASAKQTDENS